MLTNIVIDRFRFYAWLLGILLLGLAACEHKEERHHLMEIKLGRATLLVEPEFVRSDLISELNAAVPLDTTDDSALLFIPVRLLERAVGLPLDEPEGAAYSLKISNTVSAGASNTFDTGSLRSMLTDANVQKWDLNDVTGTALTAIRWNEYTYLVVDGSIPSDTDAPGPQVLATCVEYRTRVKSVIADICRRSFDISGMTFELTIPDKHVDVAVELERAMRCFVGVWERRATMRDHRIDLGTCLSTNRFSG